MKSFWACIAAAMLWLIFVANVMGQTQEAAKAVVDVRAGCYGGSGLLVDSDGLNYWGLTAKHVVKGSQKICVQVAGIEKPFCAEVIEETAGVHSAGIDLAVFRFQSTVPLTIVPLATIAEHPEVGEPVWSAGFPGFARDKLVVRRGVITDGHAAPTLSFPIARGESGSPVFSSAGCIGILGGHYKGTEESYFTNVGRLGAEEEVDCGLLGRRRDGCSNGQCQVPQGSQPAANPHETVVTPAVPNVAATVMEIRDGVAANRQGISQLAAMVAEHEAARRAGTGEIKAILTDPEPEAPPSIFPKLLAGLGVGGVALVIVCAVGAFASAGREVVEQAGFNLDTE